jgi:heme-degrading monooxygenase HmoA
VRQGKPTRADWKKADRSKANHRAGTKLPAYEGNGMREAEVKETISHNASKG